MGLNFRVATRKNVKLLIGLSGMSWTGKTLSALKIGFGLANRDASKLVFIDTENGRGSLYSDALGQENSFTIADMFPPFSPAKYAEAIRDAEKAGAEVVIVDSFSHAWEGDGGAIDIAESALSRGKKVADWITAKAEWKKMMNVLLMANVHVIICMRARPKVRLDRVDGKQVYIDQGVMSIVEKNAIFEMTASLMMHDSGTRQEILKCPAELRPILGREKGYLTEEDGISLRRWIDGGAIIDIELKLAEERLSVASEGGMKSLEECWKSLPIETRKKFGNKCPPEMKTMASNVDSLREPGSDG